MQDFFVKATFEDGNVIRTGFKANSLKEVIAYYLGKSFENAQEKMVKCVQVDIQDA